MKESVLVVGGAGYIGSHMVKLLGQAGYRVVILDNLATGHEDAITSGTFVKGDLTQPRDITHALADHPVDLVMHFAAFCYVGESVTQPGKYYRNNVVGTLNLLDAMLDAGVRRFVFSSTCATYGVPEGDRLNETHPQRPINPYGSSKLMVERILADYAVAHALNSVALRYFNAAGCDPEGELGERHDPETHLIPLVLREALRIRQGGDPAQTALKVNGDDFATPDGTCIRDYIHIRDICEAHLAAARRLLAGQVAGMEAYNLGTEQGYSVKAVIEACRKVTGADIRYHIVGRREGDPPRLVADAAKAHAVLGWQPAYSALETIVETAWRFMVKQG